MEQKKSWRDRQLLSSVGPRESSRCLWMKWNKKVINNSQIHDLFSIMCPRLVCFRLNFSRPLGTCVRARRTLGRLNHRCGKVFVPLLKWNSTYSPQEKAKLSFRFFSSIFISKRTQITFASLSIRKTYNKTWHFIGYWKILHALTTTMSNWWTSFFYLLGLFMWFSNLCFFIWRNEIFSIIHKMYLQVYASSNHGCRLARFLHANPYERIHQKKPLRSHLN